MNKVLSLTMVGLSAGLIGFSVAKAEQLFANTSSASCASSLHSEIQELGKVEVSIGNYQKETDSLQFLLIPPTGETGNRQLDLPRNCTLLKLSELGTDKNFLEANSAGFVLTVANPNFDAKGQKK